MNPYIAHKIWFNISVSLWLQMILIVSSAHVYAGDNKLHRSNKFKENRVLFVKNNGQWLGNIDARAETENAAVFLEADRITYHLYDKEWIRANHIAKSNSGSMRHHAFQSIFVGAKRNGQWKYSEPVNYFLNFFIGNRKENHQGKIFPMQNAMLENAWTGINIQAESGNNSLKYTYIVKPGSDYTQIKIQYKGCDQVMLKDGALHLKTSLGNIVEEKPFAYQWIDGQKKIIPCNYLLHENIVSFATENYDKSQILYIDPILIFASYSGSTADNFGFTATYDNEGNLYAGGITFSIGYPVTLGAFDETYNGIVQSGITDAVISKFDSSGTFLHYSTYLGGAAGTEAVNSLVVNEQGELYAYGVTGSSDFPYQSSSFDTTFNGGVTIAFPSNGTTFNAGTDIFIVRFNTAGTALLGSTFLGGTNNDGLNASSLQFNYADHFRGEINLDDSSSVYIASTTNSIDFPVSNNAFQGSLGGGFDGIIVKMDKTLSTLLNSTYWGGSNDEALYAISIDDSLHPYVAGGINGANMIMSANAYQAGYSGGAADGIVAHFNPDLSQIIGSSYIGTTEYDQCYFVQVNKAREVFLFGQTQGAFPVSPGVYSNPGSGQFLIKLDNVLNTRLVSTVFGNGTSNDQPSLSPTAFLVDICNNVYVSGWARGLLTGIPVTGMPLSPGTFQSTTDGFDFYLGVFAPDFSSLLYGTYFGGASSNEHVDGGTSRFDKKGIVYQSVCAGCGSQDDFPTTANAWSTTNGSNNCNIGVFKFDFEIRLAISDFTPTPQQGCLPLTVQFNNTSGFTNQFFWDFGTLGSSTQSNPTLTFTQAGVYPIRLIANDSLSCNGSDTTIKYITVWEGPQASFTYSNLSCDNNVNFQNTSQASGSIINFFDWDFGDGNTSAQNNPSHLYLNPGTYPVVFIVEDANGCRDTTTQNIVLNSLTAQGNYTATCGNNAVQFNLITSGVNGQQWLFNDPLNPGASSNLANPQFTFSGPGSYNSQLIIFFGPGNNCSDTLNLNVLIVEKPQAIIAYEQDSCSNNFSFSDLSNVLNDTIISRSWNTGDGFTTTDSAFSHLFNPGTYTIRLIIQTSLGCIDTSEITLTIKNYPAFLTSSDTGLCLPGNLKLFAQGGDFYQWTPASLFDNPNSNQPTINVTSSIIVNVLIGRIQANGDTCSINVPIDISLSIAATTNAQLTADPDSIFLGQSTNLILSGISGDPYLWIPSAGITTTGSGIYKVTPDESTNYSAVIRYDEFCYDTLNAKVFVMVTPCEEGPFFVPNTFTPNLDGRNDVFRVKAYSMAQQEGFLFEIFNRWGEKVFSTDDPKTGWDGTYKNQNADQGVYAYYLYFNCGESASPKLAEGDKRIKKGNITLIR
jgi:gliding motility-associated-like protein